jgi:hypothetical protein
MSSQVVFILCDNRSGSTLLEQLLGAHSRMVSIGEIHWLRAYVLNDRRYYDPPYDLLCTCGQPFADCDFWSSVSRLATRRLDELQLVINFFGGQGSDAKRRPIYKRAPRRVIIKYPALFKSRLVQEIFGAPRVARDTMVLLDAITAHADPACIVDSSKSVYRFRSLYDRYPDRTKAIILHRDYRAVVYSKMKRGASLEGAASTWAEKVNVIEKLTAGLPDDALLQLRYEDLCSDPKGEIQRVCGFVGLEFEESMLARPSEGIHDLGGSPSKFHKERKEIRFDSEYLQAFTEKELAELRRLAGRHAEHGGYSV